MLTHPHIALTFGLNERDALIHAASRGDIVEIDRITDDLARQGVCRNRGDQSRMPEWIARRPADAAPLDIGTEIANGFRDAFEAGRPAV